MRNPVRARAVALSPLFIHHRPAAYCSNWFRGKVSRAEKIDSVDSELLDAFVLVIRKERIILNSTTKAWIVAAVGIVFSIGLIVWQVKASHGAPISLTPDDMTQIASDQSP